MMSASRDFFLSPDEDYQPAFFRVAPKISRPFPQRKSFLYGLICLLWLVFGIFGRDAWKPQETLLIGIIADLIAGRESLSLADMGLEHYPPLYVQLAAFTAAAAADWLPLHEGARLINIILLTGGFVCIWVAAKRAYGIRTAWLALLLLVGCFGFMVRAHTLNFGVAAFFGMSLALPAAAILVDNHRHPSQVFISGCLVGMSSAFLLLSYGLLPALVALTALAVAKKEQSAVFIIAAIFFLLALLWAHQQEQLRFYVEWSRFSSLTAMAGALVDTLRIAGWSLLPLWPLVVYGLWYTRGRYLNALVYFMLFAVICGALVFFVSGSNEESYYFILPPLAVLAAHLLLKTPDGTAGVMDSFAVLIIGICVVGGLWLFWGTLYWQAPLPLLQQIDMAWPDYVLPPIHGGRILLAAVLTIAWVALFLNFGRHNERAVVNWSCGVTIVWAVFNLLLVEYVDSGKSYRFPIQQLKQTVADNCVEIPDNKHWWAQMNYYEVALAGASCPYYLSPQPQPQPALLYIARSSDDPGYYLYRRF